MTLPIIGISALALVGAPMFAILLAFGMLGAMTLNLNDDGTLVTRVAQELVKVFGLFTGDAGSTLATIPLFTFMGYLLAESKAAERLVNFARAWLGWFPGGLAICTVFICAMFTTFTGASGVTIVAVGGLLLPAMVKEGYKERFALGLVTGTGSIGLLFPPALPLIIYGVIYTITAQAMTGGGGEVMKLSDFKFERFLLAGIVPGLILCGTISIYAVYRAIKDKVPRIPFDLRNALRMTPIALPELALPFLMIGAMAKGIQPEEAASLGALYVLILQVAVFRDLKVQELPRITAEALRLVGAIFLVIFAATALSDYFVNAEIPNKLFQWMDTHIKQKWVFLLALNGFLLVVGSVMDIFSALLVVVPLIATAAVQYQIDPYHLGVIFLLNLEIGYVHPPVGLNLFISSFRFRKPMTELYWAILPVLGLMIVSLLLVTYVPTLSPVKVEHPLAAELDTPIQKMNAASQQIVCDGQVRTPEYCETEEVKADPIASADCMGMFAQWPRCDTFKTAEEKEACHQRICEGGLAIEDAPPADPPATP